MNIAGERMKLYEVRYDGVTWYVEAPSFGMAIAAWEHRVACLWGSDYDGDEEPDSVTLVHHEAVVRMPSAESEGADE